MGADAAAAAAAARRASAVQPAAAAGFTTIVTGHVSESRSTTSLADASTAGAAPARDARARGPAPSGHPQPSCGHLWVRTGKLMLEHPCSLTTNRLDS